MPRASLTEADLVARYGEIVAKYNSTRNAENVYDVRRKPDGALWCSCPGWRFRKACRHHDRVVQGLDDDSAVAEKQARLAQIEAVLLGAKLTVGEIIHGYVNTYERNNAGASRERQRVLGKLLDALDASGLFAPRAQRPEVPRSRGVRLITLDD